MVQIRLLNSSFGEKDEVTIFTQESRFRLFFYLKGIQVVQSFRQHNPKKRGGTMKRFTYEFTLSTVCLSCSLAYNYPRIPLIITLASFFTLFLCSLFIAQRISPVDSLSSFIPKQEYKRIRFSFITVLNVCLLSVTIEPYLMAHGYKVYTAPFYEFNNNIGYTACAVFGLSFLLLPVFKVLKWNGRVDKYIGHLKNKEILSKEYELKAFTLHRKITAWSAKQLRKWHVPISLFGMLFVFFHIYLALVSGFKWDYTYVSGYAGLLDLLLLSVLGLLRFKRVDKNLHKYLAYVLIVLLTLHVIFSELRL